MWWTGPCDQRCGVFSRVSFCARNVEQPKPNLTLVASCRVVHLGGTTDKERARFRLFIRKRARNEQPTKRGRTEGEDRERTEDTRGEVSPHAYTTRLNPVGTPFNGDIVLIGVE